MAKTPLAGVKVLDVSTMIAAPFGTALLGDFGADITKVEIPGRGDTSRSVGPFKDQEPLRWPGLSRNKKSLTLDLHKPAGVEVMKKLAATHDILVENFRPGTLEKWGVGYGVLQKVNPNLILIRVSGYGQTGPYREKAGFGTPATAFSGYTYLQGFTDRHPVSPPFSLTDYICGIYVAFAAVTALYHRDTEEDGTGQMVDVALYESVFRMMEFLVAEYDQLGKIRERSPGLAGHSSPSGTFKTKDDHWVVLVTSTDTTFNRLAAVMEREDFLTDPRYHTNAQRLENNEAINGLVADWIGKHTRDELQQKLDAAGVPISPVLSIADIFTNEHYQARENIVEVKHPRLGRIKVPGIVPKFEKTPGSIRSIAPDLGEHNEAILMDLGYSAEEIEELKRNDVI